MDNEDQYRGNNESPGTRNGNDIEDEEMLDVPPSEAAEHENIGISEDGHGQHSPWGGLLRLSNGGVAKGEDVPLCKHLLASLLAERWEVARDVVEEREVGREEWAGWAGGWG